jgi:hypothetical protein
MPIRVKIEQTQRGRDYTLDKRTEGREYSKEERENRK